MGHFLDFYKVLLYKILLCDAKILGNSLYTLIIETTI